MKQYLLDTQVMIWAAVDLKKISDNVKFILENPENDIWVNNLSFWEISLKYSIGKLDLGVHRPENFLQYCNEMNFSILPFSSELASNFHLLTAKHHKDTFDRMLIHTAIQINIPIISNDSDIKLYKSDGLRPMW